MQFFFFFKLRQTWTGDRNCCHFSKLFYYCQTVDLMPSCTFLSVLFRYNPRPCTGQGVSCRDGEKRPHITFSSTVEACPHQDPHCLFYNHSFILSPFCAFLNSILQVHCVHFVSTVPRISPHHLLFITNFYVNCGVYAKCSFVSILKNKSGEFQHV